MLKKSLARAHQIFQISNHSRIVINTRNTFQQIAKNVNNKKERENWYANRTRMIIGNIISTTGEFEQEHHQLGRPAYIQCYSDDDDDDGHSCDTFNRHLQGDGLSESDSWALSLRWES